MELFTLIFSATALAFVVGMLTIGIIFGWAKPNDANTQAWLFLAGFLFVTTIAAYRWYRNQSTKYK